VSLHQQTCRLQRIVRYAASFRRSLPLLQPINEENQADDEKCHADEARSASAYAEVRNGGALQATGEERDDTGEKEDNASY
jgi:hypothetical protein